MDPELERQKLIAQSLRQSVPAAVLDPTCQWVPSADAAALTALEKTPATQNELGGVLYRNMDGLYCYSIPVGNRRTRTFEFTATPDKGMRIAGLYHTHPDDRGEDEVEYFSPEDVEMSNKLKMASYIKVLKDGVVKRYQPGVTMTQRRPYPGRREGLLVSQGEVVKATTDDSN